MTLRRILLLVLLLPAAAAGAWYFLLPGPGHELLVYLFVVPVVVLNMWEWTAPELLDSVLGKKPALGKPGKKKRDQENTVSQPSSPAPLPEASSGSQLGENDSASRTRVQAESVPAPAVEVQNRALSLRQPHAETILQGVKTIEYRSVPTHIRGRVYLYASKLPAEVRFFDELGAKPGDFPTGLLVGTVEIVGCEKPLSSDQYQWQLANPQRLPEPLKPENKPQPVWFIPFRSKAPES